MITLVHFRCAGSSYAVRVEDAIEVRLLAGLQALPQAWPNVVGIIEEWGGRRDEPLTVVDPLGGEGAYLLVLDRGGQPFGLLVDAVIGIVRVDESALGPPPEGQRAPVVSGIARTADGLLLLVDVDRLERVLSG